MDIGSAAEIPANAAARDDDDDDDDELAAEEAELADDDEPRAGLGATNGPVCTMEESDACEAADGCAVNSADDTDEGI
jgi:hypothetical protein